MALQSNTQIFIGGVPIPAYKKLTLHQQIDAHHMLELICRTDVLEEISGEIASETKNFLGEVITLKISSLDTISEYRELEFKGIVTSVNNTKGFHHSGGDTVSIQAHSCSIIADDGAHYTSYSDIDLSEILERTFRGYDQSRLETNFNPQDSNALHYSVQHNESAFAYASRLASQYSEWFFYDGKTLVFGRPENEEPIELRYGHDLQEFSLGLTPKPNKFKYFTNDYLVDEIHEVLTEDVDIGANGFVGFIGGVSRELYPKETNVFVNSYADRALRQRLDNYVEHQKKANEIEQVKIQGISDNPEVHLGKTIAIKSGETHYGSFRIISISHTSTENGKYQNHFIGITTDLDTYPNTDMMAFPKSESQVAVVKENADPDKIGRIKVQFPWQKTIGEMTPWLRMITPHAGSDKGFHFIPEIGEEVLIGFEGGNAERPYVMGALYNGSKKPESWQTENNDIKAIRTRSGHTIELNDAENSESITIKDKNENLVIIDTANNNITITAGENMSLNAKNMQIHVEENLNITVGQNKTENITEDYLITANNEDKQINEAIKVSSHEYTQEAQEISTNASGEIKTNAGGKITIASAEAIEYGE